MIADDNNPDDVHKCDVDHPADECRYGLVEIRSAMNSFVNTFGTVQSYNDLSLICNRELVGQTTETGW